MTTKNIGKRKKVIKSNGKVGAPTRYTPELIEKAKEYIERWEELGDPVPMLCGMYVHCGIHKGLGSKWRGDAEKVEFHELCARVEVQQERELLRKGLIRSTDSSLTKLMLMRHGYTDRQEIDHTTKGESINATATKEQLTAAQKAILEKIEED
jgi:hypothetical protein